MRLLTVFLSLFLLSPISSMAQDRDAVQSGEIVLEQDEQKGDSYKEMQNKALTFFADLQQRVEKAEAGTAPSSFDPMDENALVYLTSAFLYCTINMGTCPAVLDAMLEADLINSKLSGQTKCPNLKGFWKLWLRFDMEARLRYSVKTGFLAETEAFKKNERPKYIRCENTINQMLEGSGEASSFFKNRYSGDSQPKKSAQKAAKILTEIKEKVPNVMIAVGAR